MKIFLIAERYLWSSFEIWYDAYPQLDNREIEIVSEIESSLRKPWEWFEPLNEKVTIEVMESDTPASECFSEDIWLD